MLVQKAGQKAAICQRRDLAVFSGFASVLRRKPEGVAMNLLRMFCRPLAGLAGAVAILLLAGAAAQAFTFEDKNTADGAAAKFSDPADRTKSRLSGDSSDKSRPPSGSTTLQFGNRSTFDERNDPNRMFSPNNLMGK